MVIVMNTLFLTPLKENNTYRQGAPQSRSRQIRENGIGDDSPPGKTFLNVGKTLPPTQWDPQNRRHYSR